MIYILFLLISQANATEYCIASVYSIKSNRGTVTASGIPLNDNLFTAAHKTLPFGRKVRMTNLDNNKFAIVRIIDRGPFVVKRCIDIMPIVAKEIGCDGLCRVSVE